MRIITGRVILVYVDGTVHAVTCLPPMRTQFITVCRTEVHVQQRADATGVAAWPVGLQLQLTVAAFTAIITVEQRDDMVAITSLIRRRP
jgi:hypothetical protein